MSLEPSESKFPNQDHGKVEPPSPTRENPGGVYPAVDPKAAPAETVPGSGNNQAPKTDGVSAEKGGLFAD